MIAALTNHVWQSTVFAAAVALLALAFRGNQARVRYGLWFAASLKFVIPFAPLVMLGAGLESARATAAPLPIVAAMGRIGQPLIDGPLSPAVAYAPSAAVSSQVAGLVWVCGLIAVALVRLRAWRRIRAAIRVGVPATPRATLPANVRVMAVPGLLEPAVAGLWRPTLLVPDGIERHLTPAQLGAVVAHELCHVRRRDNLTAAIHMCVEAIFWFHPGVWLIGARLIDERERACDEAVLAATRTPAVYAEAILNVCRRYVAAPSAAAGMGGANLRARIEAIMARHIGRRLTVPRKAVLAAAAVLALALPLATGARGQTAAPSFDVVSIKRNISGSQDMAINVPNGTAYNVGNAPMRGTIMRAYQVKNLAGVPAWVDDERYDITAKSPGKPDPNEVSAMLRTMLADRLKLSGHIEPRELSVYALVVARPGHSGLKPVTLDCDAIRAARDAAMKTGQAPVLPAANGAPPCNYSWFGGAISSGGIPLQMFAGLLDYVAGRVVVDQTGLTGRYEFTLRFRHRGHSPPAAPTARRISSRRFRSSSGCGWKRHARRSIRL